MSHLSTIKTEIRNLECALLAAQALGIEQCATKKTFKTYYSVNNKNNHPAEVVFGKDKWQYNIGLVKQKDGTYGFQFDAWGVKDVDHAGNWANKFGPGFSDWVSGTQQTSHGAVDGHVGVGKPTLFMQEYALQCGEQGARQRGMLAERIKQKSGDVILKMTGGPLKANQAITLTARTDGTTTVGAFNIKGPSCKDATKWLEVVLGSITSDQLTGEFYHAEHKGVVSHMQKQGR